MPKRLKLDFPEHEVYTVRDRGWNGIKNGALLQLMLKNDVHALPRSLISPTVYLDPLPQTNFVRATFW